MLFLSRDSLKELATCGGAMLGPVVVLGLEATACARRPAGIDTHPSWSSTSVKVFRQPFPRSRSCSPLVLGGAHRPLRSRCSWENMVPDTQATC